MGIALLSDCMMLGMMLWCSQHISTVPLRTSTLSTSCASPLPIMKSVLNWGVPCSYLSQAAIDVLYGPRYQVAVIYAPPNQPFICFEPMTAITNGANLAHDGKYGELQTVASGGTWRESFWVRWSGF
jgi:hypothetical protein